MKKKHKRQSGASQLLLVLIVLVVLVLLTTSIQLLSLMRLRQSVSGLSSQQAFFTAEGVMFETARRINDSHVAGSPWPAIPVAPAPGSTDSLTYTLDEVEVERDITRTADAEYSIEVETRKRNTKRKLVGVISAGSTTTTSVTTETLNLKPDELEFFTQTQPVTLAPGQGLLMKIRNKNLADPNSFIGFNTARDPNFADNIILIHTINNTGATPITLPVYTGPADGSLNHRWRCKELCPSGGMMLYGFGGHEYAVRELGFQPAGTLIRGGVDVILDDDEVDITGDLRVRIIVADSYVYSNPITDVGNFKYIKDITVNGKKEDFECEEGGFDLVTDVINDCSFTTTQDGEVVIWYEESAATFDLGDEYFVGTTKTTTTTIPQGLSYEEVEPDPDP